MLITLTLFNYFVLLPAWGGYTGDNMLLWSAVAALLLSPGVLLWYREGRKEVKKNARK